MKLAPELPSFKQLTDAETQIAIIDQARHQFIRNLMILANGNHNQPIKVSKREIAQILTLGSLTYGIGGLGAATLLGVAKSAAEGDPFYDFLYQFSSEFFNLILGGYFFYLVVSAGIEALVPYLSKDAQDALSRLMRKDPSTKAKLAKWAMAAVVFLPMLGISGASMYPSFYLDERTSDHPPILRDAAFIALTVMQYTGVDSALRTLASVIAWPFKALYRKLNDNAMRTHRLSQTCQALKFAHQDSWRLAHSELLRILQTNDQINLDPTIYALAAKTDASLSDTKLLFFKLLALAKKDEFQSHPKIRAFVQIVSQIAVIASTVGFFTPTIESVTEFGDLKNEFAKYFWGSSVFLIGSVLLSVIVSLEVVGNLYDIFAYARNGISDSWKNSKNMKDFASNAWNNKFNMASWEKIMRLPLAIQQNPKTMLSLLAIIYGLSHPSAAVSTYLNELTLGKEVAKYFKHMTIISVMIFNCYPIDKVFGSGQQFLTRLLGKEQSKTDIKLAEFIKKQETHTSMIEEFELLSGLNSLIEDNDITFTDEVENTIQTLMGGKTVEEILGSEHATKKFTDVIPELQKEVKKMQKTSCCASMFKCCKGKEPNPEKIPLLPIVGDGQAQSTSWGMSAMSFFKGLWHQKPAANLESDPLLAPSKPSHYASKPSHYGSVLKNPS